MSTAAGALYSGVESVVPVCSLSLSAAGGSLLDAALEPYAPLVRTYRGKATFQPQRAAAASPAESAAFGSHTSASSPSLPLAASSLLPHSSATAAAAAAEPRVLVDVDLPEALSEHRVLLLVPVLDSANAPELVATQRTTACRQRTQPPLLIAAHYGLGPASLSLSLCAVSSPW